MPAQSFTTHEAAKIAGVKPKRLASWLDRAILPAVRPGQGGMRTFRRDEIVRIAIVNRLTRLGMKPTPAARIAEQFGGALGVLIVDPDSGVFLLDGDAIVSTAVAIVDLSRLHREVAARIAA